jgi:hypothetical protein
MSMTFKSTLRPVPGIKGLSRLIHKAEFRNSAEFWERRYARGGNSGAGSYGPLGEGKANFLNSFVRDNNVKSVIEFGCGDGNQLSLADYPSYIGLDISPTALAVCLSIFKDDTSKSFFPYHTKCFADRHGALSAELALSLDVIYHLVEDEVFESYMGHLFAAANRHVIIYSTNIAFSSSAPHVRHRKFTAWVDAHCPQWSLVSTAAGPAETHPSASFFVYGLRQ